MKAILLAAGVGKRMGPDAGPKCLLKITGRSLLQMTFEAIQSVGIRDLVLVVGFHKEDVQSHARAHAGNLRLTVLENPRYQEGAILSLWTARSHFDEDLLIMDADVVCPLVFFDKLIRSVYKNCLLVDPSAANTGEEQMVLGKGKRVLFITKRPSRELLDEMTCFGESVGFLKLEREAAGWLRKLLEAKIEAGVVNIEHEQVYPDLFQQIQLGFEKSDGLPWIEIDTPEDLERARKQILPQEASSLCLNRKISCLLLPSILRFPITPNQWTALSLVLGLASVAFLSLGDYPNGLVAAGLFQFFYLVDNWDGEVARAKGLTSTWGGWFDIGVDALVQISFGLALAIGLQKSGAPSWVMGVGGVTGLGLALDFLVTSWARIKGFGPAIFGDPSRNWPVSSDSGLMRWIRTNLTHENFSLLVVVALMLNWRLPLLILMASGCHLYWLQFLWRERHRLWGGL